MSTQNRPEKCRPTYRLVSNVGLTEEKVVGALIHCIPYIGFPRLLNGLTRLKEVMAERGIAPKPPAG